MTKKERVISREEINILFSQEIIANDKFISVKDLKISFVTRWTATSTLR